MERQEVAKIIEGCQSATEFAIKLYPQMAQELLSAPTQYKKILVQSRSINRAHRLCNALEILWPERFSRRGRKIPSVDYIRIYKQKAGEIA